MKKLFILLIAILIISAFSISYASRSISKGGVVSEELLEKLTAVKETISKVEITFDEPVDGGNRIEIEDTTCTEGVEITAVTWSDSKTWMSASATYVAGEQYSVRIFFKAKDGYSIVDDPEVTLNGAEIKEDNRGDGYYLFDKQYIIPKEVVPAPETIETVSKVEIEMPMPKIGDLAITKEDLKISKGAVISGYSCAVDKTYLFMSDDEKYEEGSYTFMIFFKADYGYELKDGFRAFFNGEEVALEKDGPDVWMFKRVITVNKDGSAEASASKKLILTNIEFIVDAPEVGKALPTEFKVSSNLYEEGTQCKIGEKKEDTLGEWAPADKEVKAGSKYTFKATIELKNSLAEISKDLKVTVNKQEVKPTVKDGVYTIEYAFETAKAEEKVEEKAEEKVEEKVEEKPATNEMYNQFAFEIMQPEIGDKPDTKAKAMREDYEVTKVEWLTKDEKFVAGETYTVRIYFNMLNKNVRSDYYATVNGIAADLPDGDANYEKNTMYAEYTFPTLRDNSKKITWSAASGWAIDELSKASTTGLIPDILDKEDLKQNITRKEFAHIAVRLYELISNQGIRVTYAPFKDTDDIEIAKAYKVGITNGISETEFAPDALITREQMATMMTRALEKAYVDTYVDLEKVKEFSDDKDMHNWSRSAIYFMSSVEIIKGMGDGSFGVTNNASREQSIIIAVRSAEKFASSK